MKAVRYVSRQVPINLWQSVLWLFQHGEWTRSKITFDPVMPGEKGYDEAPYEMCVIYGRTFDTEKFDHKP